MVEMGHRAIKDFKDSNELTNIKLDFGSESFLAKVDECNKRMVA